MQPKIYTHRGLDYQFDATESLESALVRSMATGLTFVETQYSDAPLMFEYTQYKVRIAYFGPRGRIMWEDVIRVVLFISVTLGL